MKQKIIAAMMTKAEAVVAVNENDIEPCENDKLPVGINIVECQHEFVEYYGLNETFKYCKKCDKKN